MIRSNCMTCIGRFALFVAVNLFFMSGPLLAQLDTLQGKQAPATEPADTSRSLLSKFVDTDSFQVAYHYPLSDQPGGIYSDTTGYAYIYQYDPARRQDIDLIHLGMPGTPARPVLFDPAMPLGNQPGLTGYAPYISSYEALPFYTLDKTFADLAFLRGGDQDDYLFKARFAQQFQNDLQWSLDYRRMGQIGEYRGQRLRNTSFSTGFQFSWLKKRMLTQVILTENSFLQDENGGVSTTALFDEPGYQQRIGIPVYLDNARTYFGQRQYALANTYHLVEGEAPLSLFHRFSYTGQNFKFYDISPSRSEDYYAPEFITDSRGLRHAFRWTNYRNEAGLQWQLKGSERAFRVPSVEGAIIQQSVLWDQEAERTRFNEWYIRAGASFNWGSWLSANATYQNGLADAGQFNLLKISGDLSLGRSLALTGGYSRQQSPAWLIGRELYISYRPVYNISPEALKLNKWDATLRIPYTGTEISAALLRGLDWLWYDQKGLPSALDAFNLIQLSWYQHARLGRMHWRHSIHFQKSAQQHILGVPEWYAKGSLYYEGRFLGRGAIWRLGLDIRYAHKFYSLGYLPISAQFTVPDESPIADLAEADLFVGMKVKVFRAFFRAENLRNLITGDVSFSTPRYPMQEFGFRIGIQWLFVD